MHSYGPGHAPPLTCTEKKIKRSKVTGIYQAFLIAFAVYAPPPPL